MKLERNQSLVLIGLKHCGKSGVGRLLARELGRPCYDADFLLEELYHTRCSQRLGCREIYAKLGKSGFDHLQLETLQQFFARFSMSASVLSLGGGAGDLDEVGQMLAGENCRVVLLEEELETLFERISAKGPDNLPPFLQSVAPETGAIETTSFAAALAEFCRLGEARLRRYRSWADLCVQCCGRGRRELAIELQDLLEF